MTLINTIINMMQGFFTPTSSLEEMEVNLDDLKERKKRVYMKYGFLHSYFMQKASNSLAGIGLQLDRAMMGDLDEAYHESSESLKRKIDSTSSSGDAIKKIFGDISEEELESKKDELKAELKELTLEIDCLELVIKHVRFEETGSYYAALEEDYDVEDSYEDDEEDVVSSTSLTLDITSYDFDKKKSPFSGSFTKDPKSYFGRNGIIIAFIKKLKN